MKKQVLVLLAIIILFCLAFVLSESVNIATSNTKLYYNSSINDARSILNKSNLPSLLADGNLTDTYNVTYSYNQTIRIGSKRILYSNSEGDLTDPALLIETGSCCIADSDSSRLYKYTLSFDQHVNLSNSSIYGRSIRILGKDYTISSNSSGSILYLQDGARLIKLAQGYAREGESGTTIWGTLVNISTDSEGNIPSFSVSIVSKSATHDYIAINETFTDQVFTNLTLIFADVVPDLNADSRDKVIFDTDNSRNAKVTFTSALAGESGEKTIYFAHDQDSSDSTVTTLLADQSNYTISVVEGQELLLNQYAVINAGDYGRIVRVTELPSGNFETTSEIQLEDVITGMSIFDGGLTIGTDGQASASIDGNTYYFNVTRNSSINGLQITWGAGASAGYVGAQITVFPRIKTAKGDWVALLTPVYTPAGQYSLPGIQTLVDYETGVAITGDMKSVTAGNVKYTTSGANATLQITGVDTNNDNSPECLLNATTGATGAAILFVEEKKSNETGNANNGDAICVNVDLSGGTPPIEVSVSQPKITSVSSGLQSLTSDSNLQRAITRYGSFIEYDSTDNDKVTIKCPDEQMYADVLFTSNSTIQTTYDYNISACSNITESGSYRLNASISGCGNTACINITASNVEIDCQTVFEIGYMTGQTSIGILADGTNNSKLANITIKNCKISDWQYFFVYGIYFDYVENSSILNTSIHTAKNGIAFFSSRKNQIINSTIANVYGANIQLNYSIYNNITGCTLYNNTHYVEGSLIFYPSIQIVSDDSDYNLNSSFNRFWNNLLNNSEWDYDTGTVKTGPNINIFGRNYTNYFNITPISGTNIIGGSWIGGNYWNDYYQNDTTGDYIGDTDYIINETYMRDLAVLVYSSNYTAPPIPTSGNSGGGGVSYSTYPIGELKEAEAISRELRKGDNINFNLNSEGHNLKIRSITKDNATIEINSTLARFTLEIGESRMLNLSNSEFYDFYVRLNSINNLKANITIKKIIEFISPKSEEKKEDTTGAIPNETKPEEEQKRIIEQSSSSFLVYFISGILVGAIIAGALFSLYRKIRKQDSV